MRFMRSVIALDPRLFGRGRLFNLTFSREPAVPNVPEELKLFALTFVGGFLFMAIFLA